jgi:hypothetical protein
VFLRLLLTSAVVAGWAAPVAATTYYVSPAGSNALSGTSPDQAWQTIARVNAHTFSPGDRILFEGGKTFSGNLYFDRFDAGRPDLPVMVSSYGSGRATIYAGNGRGILIYNAAGFEIHDLFLIGSGRDLNTESGILVINDQPGDVILDHVSIDHVDVARFGDYGVEISGSNAGSGFRDVRITYTVASENGLGGIFTYAGRRAVHRNVYVAHSSAFLNAGFAGLLYNSGNGITLAGVNGGVIERCVARDNGWRSNAGNGPIGIWTYDSNNVTIQFNESYNNKTGGTKDGGGFSLDNSTSNSIIQYNYSHDNAGAGFLLAHKFDDLVHSGNVVRWNISQNDARKNNYAAIHLWGRIRNAEIYNNTIYMTYPGGGARALHARNSSIELQDPQAVHFRNNLVVTKGGVPLVDVTRTALDAATDVRFENNLYWSSGGAFKIMWAGVTYTSLAAWVAATGQERINGQTVGLVGDPELMAPGAGPGFNNASLIGGLYHYRVKATSPAIDRGMDLLSRGVNTGSRDYFGGASRRHLAPDIGAHEFYVSCNWTLAPASASAPVAGASGTVSVWAASEDCGWAAVPAAAWLGVTTESGSGAGATGYWVHANPGAARTATIAIADQRFTVTQEGSVAPPPSGSSEDVVLYASQASVASGWSVVADSTAAGSARLQNPNMNAAKITTALAAPAQYFEMTFNALAGRPYRLWMRGKATSNSYANDSVHVQFDKSIDGSGAAVWRIGGTDSTVVNLEDCSGCGVSGWGWQDNGYGAGVMGPVVYFSVSGTQRIRVQTREDGLGIDQIVLSSVKWLNASPGVLKNDTTILAR